MKIKVILLKNIKGLGNARSVVSVSRGYASNYLFPKGLAKEISEKKADSVITKIKDEEESKKARALEEKNILESKKIVIKAKSGESDKLFGSITSSDIEDKIKILFDLKVDKKQIRLEKPIKKLGEYKVPVKLYKEINAELTVIVIKEA
jgi:large subunit ribosomal protein L9